MADEVPVSDVLCEAMEYLTKLGSNLRSRSENLKEKRINKDKLKNSHAVQKAASKVLLICELSKKSLDNVEAGVRKVLSLVGKTRGASSSISAKTSNDEHRTSKVKDYYFDYNSRKLRISKKIPVKHYMSAKILAKRMTTSMQEKYPVYLDCKLYRSRKRLLERKKSKDNTEQCKKRKISVYESDAEHRSKKVNELTQKTSWNESDDCILACDQSEKSSHETKTKLNVDDVTLNKADDGNEPNKITESEIQIDNDSEKETDNKKSENQTVGKKDLARNKEAKEKSDNSLQVKNGASYVIDSGDDFVTSAKHKDKRKDDHRDGKKNRKKDKKYKHIIPLDNSDDEDEEKQIKSPQNEKTSLGDEKKCGKDDEEEHPSSESQKIKLPDAKNALHDEIEFNKIIKEKEKLEIEETDDKESEKPLIRCVNISKLLKPDVVDDIVQKSVRTGTKNNNELQIRKKRKAQTEDNITNIKSTTVKNTFDEEEYWAQKRKEIKSFKNKDFYVNITRLPRLTVEFLNSHHLTRITQAGTVICKSEKQNGKISVKDISEVKSSLLNDSESDNETALPVTVASKNTNPDDTEPVNNTSDENETHSTDKTTKVTDVHSNGSGSDKETHNTRHKPATNKSPDSNKEYSPTKIKHALLYESDSHKNDGSDVEINNKKENESRAKSNVIETIKDALLNDSDSDKIEEQGNKDKNVEQGNKDKSEDEDSDRNTEAKLKECQKKVTELIKSSLLNNSDSDKNENKDNDTEVDIKDDDKSLNCKDNPKNDVPQKNDVVLDEKSNGKDSEKPSPSRDLESVKSALLNDSSDESSAATQKSSKKEKQLRMRKCYEESVKAKKKLLNYSSSSDAGNEESDEDICKKPKRKKHRKSSRRLISPFSSNDDDINNPKKKTKLGPKSSEKNKSEDSDNENSSNNAQTSQIDGATDKQTSRKMVRSKAKPCGSSGHSSDNQDDKDIDGLANLNSLNKPHRRRDSSSTTATNNTQDTTSSKQKGRSKPSTIGEDLLQPDSSSDSISDNGQDNSDVEELPPVSLAGLNGGSIDHLAKDDLLNDSDSSGSHDKDKNEEVPNADDSEEENNLKLKRRKANAISSDSEVGSSRRKARDVRLSDFEDSEDSETVKKTKRKKGSDSDGSGNSSDTGKKKRRRIKQLNDSDDGSGSDTETEGRNKHGRKNIRKVMGKNQLEEATKKAAREEKERIARITERQKLYNNLEFDESGKPDEVVLEKVVLDFDPETKEPLIEVDRGLVKKLKPHQANGIKFMWNACFESVKRIKKDKGSGCILAHCMGLGKTLQVISLVHTLLTQSRLTGVRRVLVVCPLSTVLNWVSEVRMWLDYAHNDYQLDVYELSRYKQNSERAYQLQQWLEGGGVCVLGYEMFRNLSADNPKKYKKKILKSFQESLVDPGPDLVVCDEGHLLKNEKTSLSQSMNRVKTLRRIVLTGTPLQNNLKEYYCMVQFVKPNLLGKYNEYLNRFVNPITNGQYTDSTEQDIRVMKRRSHVLHKMLDGAVQRRDYGVLAPFLPPKHEYVLFITLTDVQVKLYQHYLDNYSRRPMPGKSSGFLFPDFQSLQRIWTHPLVLKYNSERYEIMQQKKRDREEEDSEGSLVDFIDDESTPDESSSEDSSDDLSDMSDDSRKKSKKKKAAKKGKGKDTKVTTRRGTRANPVEIDDDDVPLADDVVEVRSGSDNPTEWWVPLVADDELADLRHSHKLVLLFDILRQCEAIGDKLLVFSQSLYSLDLIEHFLDKVDQATQEGRIDEKLGGHVGTWSPGVDYFRLDGSTSCENRSIWCKNFNREDNPRARLFLISTRAGGLGINLVAANRVVIFDVSWNPSHDVQSIFRVYRFGQKKPCYVYRFLAMGTMEEKIYERQVTKQAISKRVIDEQQIDRHYAENDLAELYTFQPRPDEPRALPTLPKDRLFAEMLKEHDVQIYKYHEHDSLLENKEEETLSEEERKAAWEDFENEKTRPPPAAFPNAWAMHNGMVPGLLAQQQQQLAVAALTAMLRKDMPNMTENQIRDMLPLIYNSNPGMFGGYDYGLMQKMGEIYKYAQPGMMNPGMMNPVMNPGGVGGGMGGTSGLQYEPPWQRQHQQQQQMRLQQLLQQQNQMGAKFYAGGLGSRDPVAMALQQQRAREIMLSGGGAGGAGGATAAGGGGPATAAGRPRGRPPLQPRAPSAHQAPLAHTGDVVDLDSD